MREGEATVPPVARVFPDVNGEQPSDDPEAARMGTLVSHEPRRKENITTNQYVVIIKPHRLRPKTNPSLLLIP